MRSLLMAELPLESPRKASPEILGSETEFQQGGIVPTLMNAKSAREVRVHRSGKPSSVAKAPRWKQGSRKNSSWRVRPLKESQESKPRSTTEARPNFRESAQNQPSKHRSLPTRLPSVHLLHRSSAKFPQSAPRLAELDNQEHTLHLAFPGFFRPNCGRVLGLLGFTMVNLGKCPFPLNRSCLAAPM